MTAYPGYLHKLVDEYNNTYHRFIGKKPIHADCLELGLLSVRILLANVTPIIGQKKYLRLILC